MKMLVARSYFFITFYWQYQLPVVSILSLFFLSCHQFPSLFLYFLNVCNSYNRQEPMPISCNRSLLRMYVVAYEKSSNTENFYQTKRCQWIMFVTAVCFLFLHMIILRHLRQHTFIFNSQVSYVLNLVCTSLIMSAATLNITQARRIM